MFKNKNTYCGVANGGLKNEKVESLSLKMMWKIKLGAQKREKVELGYLRTFIKWIIISKTHRKED